MLGEKMEATIVALKCDALRWFQCWESCNPNLGWEKFKVALMERFQPAFE